MVEGSRMWEITLPEIINNERQWSVSNLALYPRAPDWTIASRFAARPTNKSDRGVEGGWAAMESYVNHYWSCQRDQYQWRPKATERQEKQRSDSDLEMLISNVWWLPGTIVSSKQTKRTGDSRLQAVETWELQPIWGFRQWIRTSRLCCSLLKGESTGKSRRQLTSFSIANPRWDTSNLIQMSLHLLLLICSSLLQSTERTSM